MRPFESGRGVSHRHRPRVAQLRRAPLLQRGGWGFESLAADMPLKLSSAEQPPCKRTVVGSIPTWGSLPPRSPTSAEASGSDPDQSWFESTRGDSMTAPLTVRGPPGRRSRPLAAGRAASAPPRSRNPMRRRSMAGHPAVNRTTLVRPQPSQLIPRSSNGRIFGSEPKDAWFESRPRSSILRTRTWRPCGLQHRRRGFDSFRPCSTRPGRLVGQDAGLSHR